MAAKRWCPLGALKYTKGGGMAGNLASYDDERTVAFRGPMNIPSIAVYRDKYERELTELEARERVGGGRVARELRLRDQHGRRVVQYVARSGSSYTNGDCTNSAATRNEECAGSFLHEDPELVSAVRRFGREASGGRYTRRITGATVAGLGRKRGEIVVETWNEVKVDSPQYLRLAATECPSLPPWPVPPDFAQLVPSQKLD
ncbi:hypothetical protein C8Q76DRAFT_693051 [Earliella scabrosa]|nr:hypothetical protein C8Q76DRAFT_693051 [Earliella scabrosa]